MINQSINRAFVIRAARRKEREKRERDDGVERTIDDDRIMRSVMYRVTDRPIVGWTFSFDSIVAKSDDARRKRSRRPGTVSTRRAIRLPPLHATRG